MPGRLGKTTNWADDISGQQTLDERQSTWGEIPGKVVSFDAAKQTATIQPLYKPRHNGKAVDMPELYEVPVRFPRAGDGAITHPVKAGDHMTLRPQMRSGENYHEKEDGAASDARSFSVADMEAHIAGGESLKNPIKNFDASNTHVRFNDDGSFGIKGNKNGQISLIGSQGDLMALCKEIAYWAKQTNNRLKKEPALVYRPDYALFESKFAQLEAKLSAMVVT